MRVVNTQISASARGASGVWGARAAQPALLLGVLLFALPVRAFIDVRNNCGYAVTAFWRSGAGSTYNSRCVVSSLLRLVSSLPYPCM